MPKGVTKAIELLDDRIADIRDDIAEPLAELAELEEARRRLLHDSGGPKKDEQGGVAVPKKRVRIMEPLMDIMRRRPGQSFHARELVELLGQRGIAMEQVNPENSVATAMVRLAERGLVVKLGENRFAWAEGSATNTPTTGDGPVSGPEGLSIDA